MRKLFDLKKFLRVCTWCWGFASPTRTSKRHVTPKVLIGTNMAAVSREERQGSFGESFVFGVY